MEIRTIRVSQATIVNQATRQRMNAPKTVMNVVIQTHVSRATLTIIWEKRTNSALRGSVLTELSMTMQMGTAILVLVFVVIVILCFNALAALMVSSGTQLIRPAWLKLDQSAPLGPIKILRTTPANLAKMVVCPV